MTGSLVVMGVAGCGKSSVGRALAAGLGLPLVEGDDFHPPANRDKMRRGTPLTDEDRAGWLAALGEELRRHPAGAVLACSALKRAYRERLRAASPGLRFVFLDIGREAARERVSARAHFFSPALVDSQFDTLEPPAGEALVLRVDAAAPLEAIEARVRRWLRESPDTMNG